MRPNVMPESRNTDLRWFIVVRDLVDEIDKGYLENNICTFHTLQTTYTRNLSPFTWESRGHYEVQNMTFVPKTIL